MEEDLRNQIINSPLLKKSVDGIVYLACVKPKTQGEIVEWVDQSFRDHKKRNDSPLREARERLLKLGYLSRIGSERYKSQPDPVIEYVIHLLQTGGEQKRRTRRNLTEEERRILNVILDSEWFRRTFYEEITLARDFYVKREGSRIRGNYVLIEEIAFLSEILAFTLRLHEKFPVTQPELNDFKITNDFSGFAQFWYKKHVESSVEIKKTLNDLLEKLKSRWSEYARERSLFDNLLKPPVSVLVIPRELAEKLNYSIGPRRTWYLDDIPRFL